MGAEMDKKGLRTLRGNLGLGQTEMAKLMGLSLRNYQRLESGERRVGRRHIRLAESVALEVAIKNKDPDLVPKSLLRKAITLVTMITGNWLYQNGSELADLIVAQLRLGGAIPPERDDAAPERHEHEESDSDD
jgi:transcriptional regulator with XRE-family HTH domain